MKLKFIIAALLHFIILVASVQAETINLSVAASMTNAFNEIIDRFDLTHPEVTLRPNYASSGSLAKQIEQGAPSDIYVSANPKWMNYLVEKELIVAGTHRVFAHNTLVFVSINQAAPLDLPGLTKLNLIALGAPQSVPAGQYAKQAMENSGVYDTLKKANKLVMAKDVRQALWYADQGEVDGAFVYKTDALLADNAKIVFLVPADLYDQVSYPLGLTTAGSKKELARAFYEFLGSPEAITILKKYGFESAK